MGAIKYLTLSIILVELIFVGYMSMIVIFSRARFYAYNKHSVILYFAIGAITMALLISTALWGIISHNGTVAEENIVLGLLFATGTVFTSICAVVYS